MFTNAEATIERILQIVAKCPDPYKTKCFEVLLEAYASAQFVPTAPSHAPNRQAATPPAPAAQAAPNIPEAIRQRFLSTAARLKVESTKFAALFDFNSDPFSFHALVVPGDNKADKTRNAALLLAAKSYLATGAWTADWKELKAMCVDQACYDRGNMGTYLKGAHFKTANATENVVLTSAGVAAAEALISGIVAPVTE